MTEGFAMAQSSDFRDRLGGSVLLTAEVLYYMPDHPCLLQSFSWQTMDRAPEYPRLARFLDHWRREIEAVIHSIRVAHSGGLGPARVAHVDHLLKLH
jgi:uncharacterized protein Usg